MLVYKYIQRRKHGAFTKRSLDQNYADEGDSFPGTTLVRQPKTYTQISHAMYLC